MTSNTHALKEASRFLDCLYPDTGIITYQTFPDNPSRRLSNPQIFHGPLDKCWMDLAYFNSYEAGAYVAVNQTDGTGRSVDNVTRLTSLFLDLDGSPLDPVLECPLKPHVILESSPGRFQCRWKIQPIPVTDDNRQEKIVLFRAAQTGLAKRFKGDTKVSDIARVARIPGFFNHKRESPFLVRILHLDHGPAVDLHELCKALGIDLSRKALKVHALSPSLNIHVNLESDDPIYEGERNVSIFSICRSLAYRDIRGDDLVRHALSVNETRCVPRLSEDEVLRTANSVDNYFIENSYLSPRKLAQTILESYRENAVDLVFSKGKFYSYNYDRLSYAGVDIRRLYSRMRSISKLTNSKDLLSKTLQELSAIARPGFPRDTLEYEFCRKFLTRSLESKVIFSEVYGKYQKWCRQKGVSHSQETVLRREIEFRMGVTLKRFRIGKGLHYGFVGIALKSMS
jgi:hypothetical protein